MVPPSLCTHCTLCVSHKRRLAADRTIALGPPKSFLFIRVNVCVCVMRWVNIYIYIYIYIIRYLHFITSSYLLARSSKKQMHQRLWANIADSARRIRTQTHTVRTYTAQVGGGEICRTILNLDSLPLLYSQDRIWTRAGSWRFEDQWLLYHAFSVMLLLLYAQILQVAHTHKIV